MLLLVEGRLKDPCIRELLVEKMPCLGMEDGVAAIALWQGVKDRLATLIKLTHPKSRY